MSNQKVVVFIEVNDGNAIAVSLCKKFKELSRDNKCTEVSVSPDKCEVGLFGSEIELALTNTADEFVLDASKLVTPVWVDANPYIIRQLNLYSNQSLQSGPLVIKTVRMHSAKP